MDLIWFVNVVVAAADDDELDTTIASSLLGLRQTTVIIYGTRSAICNLRDLRT